MVFSTKLFIADRVLIFLFFILVINLSAQPLRGIVIDGLTKEALAGATVLWAQDQGTVTSLDGSFEVNTNQSKIDITITFVGYEPWSGSLSSENSPLIIPMLPAENILNAAVVTTSRYAKSLGESTVSIDIIRQDLIQSNSPSSAIELLDKIPGVNVVGDQANIRGGSGFSYGAGSRVMLLVNDLPVLQFDAGYPNWSDLPIENTQQIEVVKGAASALYGSSALNGIINFRTAYPGSEPETRLTTYYTRFFKPANKSLAWWDQAPDAINFELTHKQKFGKLDLVAGGFYTTGKSFQSGVGRDYGRINFNTQYRLTDRLVLALDGNYNLGQSTGYFYWANDSTGLYIGADGTYTESKRNRYNFDPRLTYSAANGQKHRLLSRFLKVDNEVSGGRSNQSQTLFLEYHYIHPNLFWDIKSTMGLALADNQVEAQLYGDTTFSGLNLSAFTQFEKKLFNKLNLEVGLRYEYYKLRGPDKIGSTPIPTVTKESRPVLRAGLNYQPAEHTFVRASYGEGYRFPTIAEKYIKTTFGPTFVSPNPRITSETGWSSEIGLKQGVELGGWQGFLDVAVFWSEYSDMMEFVFTGFIDGFQAQNIGDTRIRGLELSFVGQSKVLGIPINILSGYTYIDPVFREFTEEINQRSSADYNVLKYRSKHQFKLDGEAKVDRWTLGVSTLYFSKMEAVDAIFELFIPGLKQFRETHLGYTVLDGRIGVTMKKVNLSFILKNVFNTEYASRPGLLDAPRHMIARMDWKF